MEYNPYAQKYYNLYKDLERIRCDKSRLVDDLSWYNGTEISNLFHSLEDYENSNDNYLSEINEIERIIEKNNKHVDEARNNIKSIFNPINLFSREQQKHRKDLRGLIKDRKIKLDKKENIRESLYSKKKSIHNIKSNIKKHINFDPKEIKNKIDVLSSDLIRLDGEIKRVLELKRNVDYSLKPILDQIENYEIKISDAKSKIHTAQLFVRNLASADNSYERAMVHEECEKTIGYGNPKRFISQQEKLIRRLEVDLEKTRVRATQVGKKSSRVIKKIVIDGNNMCYEDSDFVGLAPLIELTPILKEKYSIIIIFDSAIRSQVKAEDPEIKEKFSSGIKVHIVASEQLADETILEIASSNNFYYVLSNDRFGEYTEKDVVKNNRLIKHEIVDSRVIINDLNINVKYD